MRQKKWNRCKRECCCKVRDLQPNYDMCWWILCLFAWRFTCRQHYIKPNKNWLWRAESQQQTVISNIHCRNECTITANFVVLFSTYHSVFFFPLVNSNQFANCKADACYFAMVPFYLLCFYYFVFGIFGIRINVEIQISVVKILSTE